jgi:hypothetical protein
MEYSAVKPDPPSPSWNTSVDADKVGALAASLWHADDQIAIRMTAAQ